MSPGSSNCSHSDRQVANFKLSNFTIDDAETGQKVFLEHLGIEPAYWRRWQSMLDWYRAQGALPSGEGGGEFGILVTTTEERGIVSALFNVS